MFRDGTLWVVGKSWAIFQGMNVCYTNVAEVSYVLNLEKRSLFTEFLIYGQWLKKRDFIISQRHLKSLYCATAYLTNVVNTILAIYKLSFSNYRKSTSPEIYLRRMSQQRNSFHHTD